VKTRTDSRRASTTIAVGLALAFAPAFLTAPLRAQVSLRTVVELAQEKSNPVRLANADVKKAEAALEQTHDAYIPNLSLGSQVGYSYGFPTGQPSVGSASMQSLVMSFPQRQYIKAARAGVEAANLSLKDAREQVALEASTAYIELDTVNNELAAARQQKTFADNLVSIAIQRASVGVDSSLDLLQARLRLAQIKLSVSHLETRAATLAKQLSGLTGLPLASILTDHSSIPEIPAIIADETPRVLPGIQSAAAVARSKQLEAHGDNLAWRRPLIGFGAVYNYDSNKLNNYSTYYRNFRPNNISFGLQFTIPFFDFALRAKAKVSAAEALRAKVEAEQAEHQNDVQIANLTGTLRELAAQAEIASLKQQIADAQLKSVLTQMELGSGAGTGPGAPQQLSPKAEQLARIDERQKLQDALDSGFDLSKVRLTLLKSLGHMDDWINQLNAK
jgi:outer membrane protein TolC